MNLLRPIRACFMLGKCKVHPREVVYSLAAGIAIFLIGLLLFGYLMIWIEESYQGPASSLELRRVGGFDSLEIDFEDEMSFAAQRHAWFYLGRVDEPDGDRYDPWPIILASTEQVVCKVYSTYVLLDLISVVEFLEFLEERKKTGALWLSSSGRYILYIGPQIIRFGKDPPSEEVEAALLEFLEESDKWWELVEVPELEELMAIVPELEELMSDSQEAVSDSTPDS